MPTATENAPTTVDLTAVGKGEIRKSLMALLREHQSTIVEETSFWSRFSEATMVGQTACTLVLCDLANAVNRYKQQQRHAWTTSVRRHRPYFVTFVRTKRDREYTEGVDDLIRASDSRLVICDDFSDWEAVGRCLRAATTSMQPYSIAEVRYLSKDDCLWVQFGDNLNGVVSWSDLGIEPSRDNLITESASASISGASIEVLDAFGEIFDIDSGAVRGVLDARFRNQLRGDAEQEGKSFGERIRSFRHQAGISQVDLGTRTGLDQAVISRIERGKVRPRIDTLTRLSNALGMSLSVLLAGSSIATPAQAANRPVR